MGSHLRLPKELLDIAIEIGFFGPAVSLDGIADVLLHVGSHGTGAVVVFVVAFTGVDVDEMVLDGALNAAWHVIIDGGEFDGHTDWFVLAEHGTVRTLHRGVVEVDAKDVNPVIWRIFAENAMQTMFTDRAGRAVTDLIVVCFLSENLFSCLRGNTFHFQI